MLLEAEGIFAGYDGTEILHGVSLQVTGAGITALIGPNGAGKSTLLKTLFGLVRARQGRVLLHGENITNQPPETMYRRGMSFVLQGRSIFPRLTVLENLLIGGYHENDQHRLQVAIDEVFKRFPVLGERRKRFPANLSGGEQRMLELGRALMFRPSLILLDEPSLGLAPIVTDELYATVVNLAAAERTAFLIVEQKITKVLEVAHYCYVLDLGQNVFAGTPTELLSDGRIVDLYIGR